MEITKEFLYLFSHILSERGAGEGLSADLLSCRNNADFFKFLYRHREWFAYRVLNIRVSIPAVKFIDLLLYLETKTVDFEHVKDILDRLRLEDIRAYVCEKDSLTKL